MVAKSPEVAVCEMLESAPAWLLTTKYCPRSCEPMVIVPGETSGTVNSPIALAKIVELPTVSRAYGSPIGASSSQMSAPIPSVATPSTTPGMS